ncbi:MAG: hypothetical protein WEA77_13815 [Hyphomonas sp.]|uniref:hypothetical protein n=1 Tax=Hyphomonas sp. TaxID=87 RepID=UPI0034A03AA9
MALSYASHRRRYLYDHLISGLHFQAFVYGLATVLILLSAALPAAAPLAGGGAFLIVFVYLTQMLRVTYDTGYIMAFLRTCLPLAAAIFALSFLAIGLVLLSFFLT